MCFVGPALMVVLGAFKVSAFGGGEWSAAMFGEVVTSERTRDVVVQTIAMGLAVVVISTVLAAAFAAIYTKTDTPLRGAIPVIMFVVVATPGLFFAIAWGLLGNEQVGLVNTLLGAAFGDGARVVNAESWWGVVLVSSLRLTALQFFLLLGPFLAVDRSLHEAARTSGAGPVRAFFQIEVPVLAPAITGAVILGFVLFLESFDAPQVLGVPAGIFVIPTEIYAYLSNSTGPQFAHASSISVLLMVVLLLLVVLQVKVLGRRSFVTVGGKEARATRGETGNARWLFSALILIFFLVAIALPMFQLARVSLSPFLGATSGFSLDNYREVLTRPRMLNAYLNTAVVAVFGGLLAVLAATAFAWAARFKAGKLARFIEFSQWLGLAMPGLILALGVLWLFLGVGFLTGFYGTPVIMVFALFVAVIPIAGRATGPAMAQIPRSLEEAAWVSGASKPRAAWDVVAKLMLPSLLSGWVLCFVVICGILSVPLLLSAPRSNYVAKEIYSRYVEGNAPSAAAVALTVLLGFLVVALVGWGARYLITRTTSPGRAGEAASVRSEPAADVLITTPARNTVEHGRAREREGIT
ncbi:iron ABC transporter permease [Pseudonocardia sp. DSM 110487]|uniref:ABC transporter permease n=1 Tax=Pseudonocardia sp. DSM 110487 TaxID=2865833 RepID=UPI001C69F397|nr:iron ABC transporter permease [Pseudonocardia sp. DSM 110487]QYN39612.1 iron ABC transporter permease [Pseudonocardia sp. DSM 110487]